MTKKKKLEATLPQVEPNQLERFRLTKQEFFAINAIHGLNGVGVVFEPAVFREWSKAWGVDQQGNYEFETDDSIFEEPVLFVTIQVGRTYGP